MDQILGMAAAWWAAADTSAQVAVIVALLTFCVLLLFMIIGAHTNPTRRPSNEMGFRQFAAARLAARPGARSRRSRSGPEPARNTCSARSGTKTSGSL